ncbi:hypothetical protein [Bacillus alkalicellulosilyticus]|uniref:hypothetical protein n=1 Tax=Alkalihalobacterium alkalicellulosilyticum TaxID=1912214 RepID=UPI0009971E10|nr:hypothetical protein [Bacillus alkalicellulosilyticus]
MNNNKRPIHRPVRRPAADGVSANVVKSGNSYVFVEASAFTKAAAKALADAFQEQDQAQFQFQQQEEDGFFGPVNE